MRLPNYRSFRLSPLVRCRAMLILLGASQLALATAASAQGTTWDEAWVGSEWELYTRALGARGLVDAGSWSIRPIAPVQVRAMASGIAAAHPWAARLPRSDSLRPFVVLRPSLSGSYNSGFAWGDNDAAVWQGRGGNIWGTAGAMLRWRMVTARVEPMFGYSANTAFELRPSAGGREFGAEIDAVDLPQRHGSAPRAHVSPGNSYVRGDFGPAAVGFSTANISWGSGFRQSLLFGAGAGGFPHVFAGTNRPVDTPIGDFAAQVVYASLSQSEWAPVTANARRFGSGLALAWRPAGPSIELGVARFYHRFWPDQLGPGALLAPFGSAFYDEQISGSGAADNQLAVVFATVRVRRLGLEVFGEFGRNDRSEDLRDLALEPEHNAAWALGLLHATAPAADDSGFWTTRIEVVNARISRIQNLLRSQGHFYAHTPIAQGHTHRGQLLGTSLAEQSGGVDLSVDRWTGWGRAGAHLRERQLPGDLLVGMPETGGRSQWDAGASVTVFRGGADLHAQLGHVWDLNRFEGRDVGNFYVRLGGRVGIPPAFSP